MRSLSDLDTLIGQAPFPIVTDLRTVDTGGGSEAPYRDKLPALLTPLADRARVAGIEASSAIEGVVVEDRSRAAGNTKRLRDRSEQELAGYRAALDYLYQEQWRPSNVAPRPRSGSPTSGPPCPGSRTRRSASPSTSSSPPDSWRPTP